MPDIESPAASGAASTPSAASVTPASATATPAPAAQSTPAAAQPVAATPASQQSGEPPRERWDDILTNARKKTRSEVEAEFKQKYSGYDAFEQDPWGAVQQWLDQASKHSVYGPMVHQWAQARQKPADRGAEPEADVPIVDGQGNPTGRTFSDKQLRAWHQWNQAAQQSKLDERFAALEGRESQRAQREQQVQAYQQATRQAGETLTALRTMPYFKDHEPDIRAALEEHQEWGDNVHAAYNHVLVTKILPTLGQAEQQKVIDSIQNKAAGATVSPSGATPGKPAFKGFREAAEYFAAHPDEAKAMAERQG